MIKKAYQRCINKPNFTSQKIFDKNFVAVHCKKTVLRLNNPFMLDLVFSSLVNYQRTNFIMTMS